MSPAPGRESDRVGHTAEHAAVPPPLASGSEALFSGCIPFPSHATHILPLSKGTAAAKCISQCSAEQCETSKGGDAAAESPTPSLLGKCLLGRTNLLCKEQAAGMLQLEL